MVGFRRVAGALLVWFLAAGFARSQADPWEAIPGDALGVFAVQRLGDASARFLKLTSTMQLQVPDVLPTVQLMTGVLAGLDEQGSFVACAFPARHEGATFGMAFAVFVPVADYQAFLAQLHPVAAEQAITEINVAGLPMLAARKAGYAVLCPTDQRYLLEHILASTQGLAGSLAPLKSWIDQQQVLCVVTPAGVKHLAEQSTILIDEQAQALKDVATPVSSDADAQMQDALAPTMALMANARDLIKFVPNQISHLGAGVRVDDQAALYLTGRAAIVADGTLARWAGNIELPKGGLLAGLPTGRFVLAYGDVSANMSEPVLKALNQLSTSAFQQMGLSAAQQQQYSDALTRLAGNGLSSATMMGQLRPGDNVMSTVLSINRVKNAEEQVRLTRQALQIVADATAPVDGVGRGLYTLKDVKVGELSALEVSIDMSSLLKQNANDDALIWVEGFMAQFFGKDGISRAYLTVADPTTVVTAYSKELLQHGVRHAKFAQPGLETDPGIRNTAALLPRGAQWAFYLSPPGVFQIADTLVRETVPEELTFTVPPFPPCDPIGVGVHASSEMLSGAAVLPASVVVGIGKYLNTLEEMIERGEFRLP